MTAPSQSKNSGTVTYASITKHTSNLEAVHPKDLLYEQTMLNLRLTELGADLSQVPIALDIRQALEELDEMGYTHDTLLHLAG